MVWDNPVSERDVPYLLEVHVSNGVVPVSDGFVHVVPVSTAELILYLRELFLWCLLDVVCLVFTVELFPYIWELLLSYVPVSDGSFSLAIREVVLLFDWICSLALAE
jgi:hypothetical protein